MSGSNLAAREYTSDKKNDKTARNQKMNRVSPFASRSSFGPATGKREFRTYASS